MEDDRPQVVRRDYAPTLAIYLLSAERLEFENVYCIYCAKRFGSISGRVLSIADSPTPASTILIGIGSQCGRCKQKYRFILL